MSYLFGSHMSIAGGLHEAVVRAQAVGCDVVQIFTKNNNQWNCKPLNDTDRTAFADALERLKIGSPIAHASYLINLATPDPVLWEKSVDAMIVEWQRAEALRLEGLVVHPGAHTTSSLDAGMSQIVAAVKRCIKEVKPKYTRLLLENTAGQGTCLGCTIEQLGQLLQGIKSKHVGVCWDTCHALAAGYDFRTAAGLKAMIAELETHDVLEAIAAIHLNDSKKDCGSRVDRHEHIGQGFVGADGFKRFLKHSSIKSLPMYLETPKGIDEASGLDWDIINLKVLRDLVGAKNPTTFA